MINYYIAYILMFSGALWLNRSTNRINPKNKRTYCILFSLIWIFLLGLRHPSMGVDLNVASDYGYIGRFQYISTLSVSELLTETVQNYEPGFILFNKIISFISNDPQWLVFCSATVSVICLTIFISKNSSLPFLSSIIYLGLPVFLITYSGLRQSLAISITILSLELIRKKKLLWFILTVLLATTFHSSAIVFLVAYPIYYLKLNKSLQIASIFILPVTFVFRVPLFNLLSKILKDNAQIDNNGSTMLFIIFAAVYIFIILFCNNTDAHFNGLRNIYFLTCFCQAFSGIYSTALRVGYYFMIPLCVLIPMLINDKYRSDSNLETKRNGIIIYILVLICFSAFGLYSIKNGGWAMSYPHRFYW